MKGKKSNVFIYMILTILAVVFLAPIFIILFNSFKGKLYISDAPFKLPTAETFSGLQNYIDGLSKTGFLSAFGWSIFITFFSKIPAHARSWVRRRILPAAHPPGSYRCP